MVSFPNAKINLGLYVTEKRPDGFHTIESVFYPVPWHDVLEIIPSKKVTFTASGLSIPGKNEDNLCLKAYQLLSDNYRIPPVHIHLRKEIPMGAGLGGGSADAAFTIKMLNELFSLQLPTAEMAAHAARLGSDCAFFIYNTPQIATGVGDQLTPSSVSLKGYYLALVYPGIHIPTKKAYSGIRPAKNDVDLSALQEYPPDEWSRFLRNDFEAHIFEQHPALKNISNKLTEAGAVYTAMSGSGSAIFGIFQQPPAVNFSEDYIVKELAL